MSVPVVHGSTYLYRKGCRCDECRQANWATQKKWRDKVRGGPVPDSVHGTYNGYQIYFCHCDKCVAAKRAAGARQRASKRRLRELAARGLPQDWKGT